MSEMTLAISLVYPTSDINIGKKVYHDLKMAVILQKCQNTKQSFNLASDMIVFYIVMTSQNDPLYSCLGEVGPGSKLQEQYHINKWIS